MLQKVDRTEAGGNVSPAFSLPDEARYTSLAVCGSHPATVALAPFDDPECLIYACSPDNSPYGLGQTAKALPRVDVFFEIHNPVFDRSRPYAYLDWLKNAPKVYMRDPVAMSLRAPNGDPLFPTAEPYPEFAREVDGEKIPGMKDIFCPFLFTSSIAFIMAKAIVDCERLGIKKLGLWGILQRGGRDEYEKQRPGTQYFLWEAMRRGIDVQVAKESHLFEIPPETF